MTETTMEITAPSAQAIKARRMVFPRAEPLQAWWNSANLGFSQIVNAAFLAMPFLEPYLVATMKKAREEIKDPVLLADVAGYIA
ncbi:MAG: metal-dependent hydrolase [Gammaproteobacteria bacterium]|nr:metal-dependent hydrolase [Gammaproteobacteria bacterium]